MEIQNIETLIKEFNHLMKCKEYLSRLILYLDPYDTTVNGHPLAEVNGRTLIREIYEEIYYFNDDE